MQAAAPTQTKAQPTEKLRAFEDDIRIFAALLSDPAISGFNYGSIRKSPAALIHGSFGKTAT